MFIKSMLARLQNSLGRDDLIEQMVLLPEPKKSFSPGSGGLGSVNLIVGYSASPKSHTALDITFWIAHQTRLATNAVVKVHAVYVESSAANILFLGCRSVHHPLIQTLGDDFPCAILGIPHCIDD